MRQKGYQLKQTNLRERAACLPPFSSFKETQGGANAVGAVMERYEKLALRKDHIERIQILLKKGYSKKVYPMCRKTPCFSYGDIRRFHRIYASN